MRGERKGLSISGRVIVKGGGGEDKKGRKNN